ncbi:hypothetical protein T492DRAFT_861368 [Pavlovales sp. CCMP2436]|nr:hypothetical protein T492DRAFT_861368 [Pavlovales sp. CCMP2436]
MKCAALLLACLLGAPALAVTDTGGPLHNSDITGNVGALGDVSGFTNFAADASSEFYTSTQVTGRVYTADCAAPTPAMLTQAVSVIKTETACDDAASRSVSALANVDVMAGTIAGKTFVPGVYKWNTHLQVTSADIHLMGSADDLFIFQMDGYLVLAADVTVNLVADDTVNFCAYGTALAEVSKSTKKFKTRCALRLSMMAVVTATLLLWGAAAVLCAVANVLTGMAHVRAIASPLGLLAAFKSNFCAYGTTLAVVSNSPSLSPSRPRTV